MKPTRIQLSARFAGTVSPNGFSDVSLLAEGEAKGHQMIVDGVSIAGAAALITGKSLPAYLTHEGAGGDRLTEEVGIFSDFRIDGTKLRARSFEFLESFKTHQKVEYEKLVELARKMPDQFGVSIVFRGVSAWATAAGEEIPGDEPRPADALHTFASVRFVEIESADFVRQPAANGDGLFSEAPKPNNPPSQPQPGALAAKDAEIKTLSARVATLTAERDEARRYDMRRCGVPAVDAPSLTFDPDLGGHISGEGLSDAEKWKKYQDLLDAGRKSAAESFRRKYIASAIHSHG